MLGIDDNGLIIYVNAQVSVMFGYDADELIGQSIEVLLPQRFRAAHVRERHRFVDAAASRPMGMGLELAGLRKDGSELPVEISLASVELQDGRAVFASIVDISARKSLEGQLLQAQKMESLGRLAGGIAHDFNNMLFAIKGYADLLADDVSTNLPSELKRGDMLESLQAISATADRAAALVGQLLAFSRKQVVNPEVIDLRVAVSSLEPMLRPLIGEHVRLAVRPAPGTGQVRMDPSQFDQIVVNLVVNARDALPAGGVITIETGNVVFDAAYAVKRFEVVPGEYVMVSVSDNGTGMDPETQEHVFEPFFTTKEVGKGTGLGLATIYGVVRQAGGHVWLYSELGRGTTFKVYLPRVDGVAIHPAIAPLSASAGSGQTILVVDDEPTVRELSRKVLERAGYRIVASPDPLQALAAVQDRSVEPDLILTDVVMPGMSGPDLARKIRDILPHVAVVLLSGYTSDRLDIADLIASGARFELKPLTPRDLARVVADALADRREAGTPGS